MFSALAEHIRMAMCNRAGRGCWFALIYAAPLEHLVCRPCSSLRMDMTIMWKGARVDVSMDRLSRTMLSNPYSKSG